MSDSEKAEIQKALENRLDHKKKILAEGGEQALSHSPEDLARIERSLERLRTESYGSCITCGEAIDRERLKIYPEAERCTSCQTIHEKPFH